MIQIYNALSRATEEVEVGVIMDGEMVSWPPARAVVIAEGILNAVAEANAGDELRLDLGGHVVQASAPDAGRIAMMLTMAAASAVAENALASIVVTELGFTQEERLEFLRAYRKSAARFAEDAFQSFG